MLRPPIEPMLAKPVARLPPGRRGDDLLLEPKFDGFRAVVFRLPKGIFVQSRTGRNLTAYFPDVARLLRRALPANTILDGELVVWEPERDRTSFTQLQRRLTAGAGVRQLAARYPATLVAFDLLQNPEGRSLLSLPLARRRALLAQVLADAPTALMLCPQTTSHAEADQWVAAWTAAGIEGLVAKNPAGRYTPGKRGWLKIKTRVGAEAVVGGVTGSVNRPEALLLGRFDGNGRFRYVGRSHPLTPPQQRDLALVLTRSPQRRRGGIDHPWPQPLPAGWSGHFQKAEPLAYLQVEPVVVVEVDTDAAMDRHRWRHPVRYVRHRPDLSIFDVPLLVEE